MGERQGCVGRGRRCAEMGDRQHYSSQDKRCAEYSSSGGPHIRGEGSDLDVGYEEDSPGSGPVGGGLCPIACC